MVRYHIQRLLNLLPICLFLALFSSCREQFSTGNADPEQFTLSGRIENYNPAHGNIFAFGGLLITSGSFPEGIKIFSIKDAKINPDGTFLLVNVPPPPDSIFLVKNSNTGNYSFQNQGFFNGTDLPFMHEYIVIGGLQCTQNSFNALPITLSSPGYGYGSFQLPHTPVGTCSVAFCYIDCRYNYQRTETKTINSTTTQIWQYRLELQRGWNTIYLYKGNPNGNSITIEVSTTAPGNDYKWWVETPSD